MGVTIKNLGRLQGKLDRLVPYTHDALARGVSEAALGMEGAIKNVTPVAKVNGGTLRGSIHTLTKKTATGAEATIGTNVEYALYVELGTSRMKARPYLRRGMKSYTPKAKRKIMEEIVKAHRSLR